MNFLAHLASRVLATVAKRVTKVVAVMVHEAAFGQLHALRFSRRDTASRRYSTSSGLTALVSP